MIATKEDYFRWAVEILTTRQWTVIEVSKEENKRFKLACYVCDKRNEKLFEVICDGGEPFWFGTSCAKRLKKETGIDLVAKVKGAL